MTPRLQMKSPCTYNLDEVKSIDIPSYLSRLGFVGGIETAWISCVKRMYEDFEASFAANEGLEAVICDLAPSRRRLTVSKVSPNAYSIECEQGARVFLTATDDDSIILSFERQHVNEEDSLDLAYYDSHEAARFIGNIFRAYRKIQEDFWKQLSRKR